MAITNEEVEHVARLARLALTPAEIELFRGQLAKILEHAERVTALDTEGVAPTAHAVPVVNVTREDIVVPPLDRDLALSNVPFEEEHYFRVPRILEEDEE